MSPASASERPLPNTYWVIPGSVLAGEHPAGATPEETRARVQKLLSAGIDAFLDLTAPGELPEYDAELPVDVEYIRKPIRDHSIPARREHMVEILDSLQYLIRRRRCVYVHCRAGIGRTGTVIGCLLVERGLTGERALEELNQLWQHCGRAADWSFVPETDDQVELVRRWTRALAVSVSDDPLLQPETLQAARSLRERFLGALIGLATGDALAAATQFRKPGAFTPIGDLLGGGPYDLPRGAWTDETAMALCLAESLLECEGFDPRDQVSRYTRWQRQGYLSATGHCVGITASTVRALSMAQWRRQMFSGSHDPNQLDPEVLSRLAPVVMFFFASPARAIQFSADAARTTCQAPAALDACRLLGAILYSALCGRGKQDVLHPTPDVLDLATLRASVSGIVERSSTSAAPGAQAGGTTPEALEAALWAFRTTENFRDGALRAANLGGNSDVITAVYGQVAGAHYGVSAIPAGWRNSLSHKDLIEGLADRLLARAMLDLGG